MFTRYCQRISSVAIAVAALFLFVPARTEAQIVVKNEDVTFKFGVQGQFWGAWTQDLNQGSRGYQQNLYLRRGRIIVSGDIGKDVSFFLETDAPNLGKTPKSASAGVILQDAFLEWKPTKVFQIDGGLFIVPTSRNALQSTLSYYTLDISPLTTVSNTSTQSSALRDLGFQARGFFVKDHLHYRLGVFQGQRDSNARNSLRTAAYLQYDFFDPETGYLFAGTSLGKKRILAVNAGADKQGAYRGLSANTALAIPVNGGDEVGGQFQYYHYDGRQKFTAIPNQHDWFVEGAYYFHQIKAQPFAKFESQNFSAPSLNIKDVNRVGAGLNYYVHGQNLKWTFQYNRVLPHSGSGLQAGNEALVQLQVSYF